MSTIDAAIIKALVEHVGGDSSGIPDGDIGVGGGGSRYKEVSFEYTSDSSTYEMTLTSSTDFALNIGTKFVITYKNEGYTPTTYVYHVAIAGDYYLAFDIESGYRLMIEVLDSKTIKLGFQNPSRDDIFDDPTTVINSFKMYNIELNDVEPLIYELIFKVVTAHHNV